MPSPIPVERFLPRDLSPSIDLRPCSSPLELSRYKSGDGSAFCSRPAPRRLPPRLAWCSIDWEQVRILEPLGSGGFGSVYRATYRGQTVALKKVKRSSKNRLASRQSFWGELNAARLCHPHVIRVLAASASCPGDTGSPGTIIMEYAGSCTLHRRIYGRSPPLGKACCLRYARHITDGLRFLHRGGVVHLDLKPANVLLASGDLCKIGDFGCSQRMREHDGEACNTQLRHLGGTYTHRAPELLRGEPVTAKADIYSFAITLWQMVTRELPYTGDRQCVLYAVVAYDLRPEIGDIFLGTEEGKLTRDIVQNCWAARPEERPNAEELINAIDLIHTEEDSPMVPEHSPKQGGPQDSPMVLKHSPMAPEQRPMVPEHSPQQGGPQKDSPMILEHSLQQGGPQEHSPMAPEHSPKQGGPQDSPMVLKHSPQQGGPQEHSPMVLKHSPMVPEHSPQQGGPQEDSPMVLKHSLKQGGPQKDSPMVPEHSPQQGGPQEDSPMVPEHSPQQGGPQEDSPMVPEHSPQQGGPQEDSPMVPEHSPQQGGPQEDSPMVPEHSPQQGGPQEDSPMVPEHSPQQGGPQEDSPMVPEHSPQQGGPQEDSPMVHEHSPQQSAPQKSPSIGDNQDCPSSAHTTCLQDLSS
ncbi:proto-oncogene serine/threonine-protein kinase mos isoform X2 [Rana temporaria]|uniref:proto-oncogene serine/threonine-protein kinase mos isoform X2 n=1 Tax=Rana temporaria TaxID=8407 RepID=UPI001AAC57DA|nr:proto-oncogene serine/threonine-protein kinase mos isoform X2 [Rana temporaria]